MPSIHPPLDFGEAVFRRIISSINTLIWVKGITIKLLKQECLTCFLQQQGSHSEYSGMSNRGKERRDQISDQIIWVFALYSKYDEMP